MQIQECNVPLVVLASNISLFFFNLSEFTTIYDYIFIVLVTLSMLKATPKYG